MKVKKFVYKEARAGGKGAELLFLKKVDFYTEFLEYVTSAAVGMSAQKKLNGIYV